MKIFEVNSEKLVKDFLDVHFLINMPYPNWIRPLDVDVMSVFDPKKNKLLAKSEAIRWVLKDDQGKLIGRIAAFVNKRYTNKGDDVPVGGFGAENLEKSRRKTLSDFDYLQVFVFR